MGSHITFTPLYGADEGVALASLLTVRGFTFLLDCGWNDDFDTALLAPLLAALPRIDAVLLSHLDTAHLGALPYLVGKMDFQVPIYATLPVHKMGQMVMYDQYLSRAAVSDFNVFDLDDVDAAFSRVVQLRYQQHVAFSGKGQGLSVAPYAAGHLIGGSVWRISLDGEDIVYAVDYNHRKERHLNGTVLSSVFSRPAVLITDATTALKGGPEKPTKEKELIDAALSALRSDGNVLMPVDTAGRVLEALLIFDRHWSEHKLTYPLVLLTPVAYNTLKFAQSQLEWLNDGLSRTFEHTRENPFACRYVKTCHTIEEFQKLPPGPKVVFASGASLKAGPSRALLAEWAPHSANLLLLPFTEAPDGTVASRVLTAAATATDEKEKFLRLQMSRRVPLEGKELSEYLDAERQRRESEAEAAAVSAAVSEPATPKPSEQPSRHSSGSISKVMRGVSGTFPILLSVGEGVEGPELPASEILVEGFTVPTGSRAPMFPFEDEEDDVVWDDYGATINENDFKLSEVVLAARAAEDMQLEVEAPAEERPTKIVTREVSVPLRARVVALDFEGRSDGRSARTIVSHIAPRHLILFHGAPAAVAAMQRLCADELQSVHTQVHTPAAGEVVDASSGSSSFRLALADNLLEGLQLRPVGDYQLAWLNGSVGPTNQSGMLELRPGASGASVVGQGGIFIGDVRLSQLKAALAEAGIPSEWSGGALVCRGHTLIRNSGDSGDLLLEGALSSEYYTIRNILYSQYHVC